MSSPLSVENENLVTLARDVATSSFTFLEKEMTILRTEIQGEWKKTLGVLPPLIAATVIAISVTLLSAFVLAESIRLYFVFSLWLAYGLVIIAGLIVSLSLFQVCLIRLRRINLEPKHTMDSFKENIECLNK